MIELCPHCGKAVDEILAILDAQPGKVMSTRQIAEHTHYTIGHTRRRLLKLWRSGLIERKGKRLGWYAPK